MEASTFLFFFLNGLTHAAHLFLLASGLSLIFGVLRILNFAHASLFMLGAYCAWQFMTWFDNFWIALLLAPLTAALVGAAIERFLLRRVYHVHVTFQLLLTFGVILVIKDVVKLIWGVNWRTFSEPDMFSGSVSILGADYPKFNLIFIALVSFIALALWLFLNKTRYGKIIRAASSDREMASALGINVPLLYTVVFALGTWLAALMGILHGPMMNITLDVDVHTIVEAFAVVVIGGLGSIPGAILGSFLVGELNAFGILIIPKFQMAFMYMLMAIILIVRPRGLLGREEV